MEKLKKFIGVMGLIGHFIWFILIVLGAAIMAWADHIMAFFGTHKDQD